MGEGKLRPNACPLSPVLYALGLVCLRFEVQTRSTQSQIEKGFQGTAALDNRSSSLADAHALLQTAVSWSGDKRAMQEDWEVSHPATVAGLLPCPFGAAAANAGTGIGTGLLPCPQSPPALALKRLGLFQQLAVVVGEGSKLRGTGASWLQLGLTSGEASAGSVPLITAIIVVVVIILLAVTVFCFQSAGGKPGLQAAESQALIEAEDTAHGSGQNSEKSERQSMGRVQSLLPVHRQASLPPIFAQARTSGRATQMAQGVPGPTAASPSASASVSAPASAAASASAASHSHASGPGLETRPGELKSSPQLQKPSNTNANLCPGASLRPAASSPPGQGVPGGRFVAGCVLNKAASPTAAEVQMPPPLCSSLVLPACEGQFAVEVPALAAIDESGGGSLDILGVTGNRLLRATAQDLSAGRLLEISMAQPGSAPRATVGPPLQPESGPSAQAKGNGPSPLEIRGADGSLYGTLEPAASNPRCHVVKRRSREVMTLQGSAGSLEIAAFAGERLVANTSCIGASNSGGTPHLELRVKAGIDPVLVISCVLAIILQSSWTA